MMCASTTALVSRDFMSRHLVKAGHDHSPARRISPKAAAAIYHILDMAASEVVKPILIGPWTPSLCSLRRSSHEQGLPWSQRKVLSQRLENAPTAQEHGRGTAAPASRTSTSGAAQCRAASSFCGLGGAPARHRTSRGRSALLVPRQKTQLHRHLSRTAVTQKAPSEGKRKLPHRAWLPRGRPRSRHVLPGLARWPLLVPLSILGALDYGSVRT